MTQETVVSWLEKEFVKLEQTIGVHGKMYELLEQAKPIDKEIICTAYLDGIDDEYTTAEQYYNETYGKDNIRV
jgi:hypothetical protein